MCELPQFERRQGCIEPPKAHVSSSTCSVNSKVHKPHSGYTKYSFRITHSCLMGSHNSLTPYGLGGVDFLCTSRLHALSLPLVARCNLSFKSAYNFLLWQHVQVSQECFPPKLPFLVVLIAQIVLNLHSSGHVRK